MGTTSRATRPRPRNHHHCILMHHVGRISSRREVLWLHISSVWLGRRVWEVRPQQAHQLGRRGFPGRAKCYEGGGEGLLESVARPLMGLPSRPRCISHRLVIWSRMPRTHFYEWHHHISLQLPCRIRKRPILRLNKAFWRLGAWLDSRPCQRSRFCCNNFHVTPVSG